MRTILLKLKPFATVASFACMIHCLAVPLFIVFVPFIGVRLHNHALEITLVSLSIFSGLWVIYSGYCKHKKKHSILLFLLGVSFWIAHTIADHHLSESMAIALLLVGTGFVIGSYYFNHRYLNCCH